jgi:acyl carrier protein phosphodiesterase
MNFFGHAVIAGRIGAPDLLGDPGYALGAMLPDFAAMCGGQLVAAARPAQAAGVALHHRTDAVFHTLPSVVALMRELHAQLLAAGCQRGPARAGSHIGVELLLDGFLLDDEASCARYLAALAAPAAELSWREPHTAPRFATLQRRLAEHGVPRDLRDAGAVTERLLRVLQRRPRLAATAQDAAILGRALASYQRRVQVAVDTVLRGVVAALRQGDDVALT